MRFRFGNFEKNEINEEVKQKEKLSKIITEVDETERMIAEAYCNIANVNLGKGGSPLQFYNNQMKELEELPEKDFKYRKKRRTIQRTNYCASILAGVTPKSFGLRIKAYAFLYGKEFDNPLDLMRYHVEEYASEDYARKYSKFLNELGKAISYAENNGWDLDNRYAVFERYIKEKREKNEIRLNGPTSNNSQNQNPTNAVEDEEEVLLEDSNAAPLVLNEEDNNEEELVLEEDDEILLEDYSKEKQKAMQIVNTYGQCLGLLDDFQDDIDVVLAAVKNDPAAIKYASERLKNNEKVKKAAGITSKKNTIV